MPGRHSDGCAGLPGVSAPSPWSRRGRSPIQGASGSEGPQEGLAEEVLPAPLWGARAGVTPEAHGTRPLKLSPVLPGGAENIGWQGGGLFGV